MSKYNLHQLGWKAFEDLCCHVMQNILGVTFTPFAEGKDGGRDGYFNGEGDLKNLEEPLRGKFAFQCKHTSDEGKSSITLSLLAEEKIKVERLVNELQIEHYVILTNYSVPAEREKEIQKEFLKIRGLKSCTVLGNEWLIKIIDQHKILRKLVPRLYGIGDLSEILDERIYRQTIEVIEEYREYISSFVVTKSYKDAVHAIQNNNFVILLGPPAIGKTSIATNIAVTSIIEDETIDTLILENAEQFKTHWNPNNPKQLFWFDDVFGATNVDFSLVREWERTFHKLNSAIRLGSKVIFTSRDYIFNEVIERIKCTSFPLLKDSKVVINVDQITLREKEQILYNHIKCGNLTKSKKTMLKPFLKKLAEHNGFTPELARRLGNTMFIKELLFSEKNLNHFFSNPTEFFEETINNLDVEKQAALVLIMINGNQLTSPVQSIDLKDYFLQSYPVTLSKIKEALEYLKNSLVKLNIISHLKFWSMYHPSMIDSLHIILSKREEMLEIYLHGSKIETIIRDISFTNNDKKLFVPKTHWCIVAERIFSCNLTVSLKEDVTRFFYYQTPDEFLVWLYNNHIDKMVNYITPSYSQFNYISTYKFVRRLQELNLFDTEWKTRFKREIKNIAIEDCDMSFVTNKDIIAIIDDNCISEVINEFIQLGPEHFKEHFNNLEDNLSEDVEDIEEYFENWFTTLDYLINKLTVNKLVSEQEVQKYHSIYNFAKADVEKLIDEREEEEEEEQDETGDIGNEEIEVDKDNDDIFTDVDK